MKPEDLYHVGIVVDDLDASLRWFTDTAGYRWCEEYAGDQVVETPAGEITVPMRFAYSMDTPRLEVLQAVPGTLWQPASSGIHHLGYWSDDVAADAAELERRGYLAEATREGSDGAPFFAFYRSPAGFRVELLSRGGQPALEQYWTTGKIPR